MILLLSAALPSRAYGTSGPTKRRGAETANVPIRRVAQSGRHLLPIMKKTNLLVLSGGVVLVLLLALATRYFVRPPATPETLDLRADDIIRLDLETPRLALTLERSEDGWRLTRPVHDRAEDNRIRGLLSTLDALEIEAVVSTNPERHAWYGVDETGKALTVHRNGDEVTLIFGRLSPDGESVFLRFANDPRVFTAQGHPALSSDLDDWRSKSAFDLGSPSHVRRATVVKEDKTYEVSRENGGWMLHVGEETVPADSVAVMRWLSRFTPLRADGFFDDMDADEIRDEAPEHLTFTFRDGSTRSFWTRIEGKYLSGVSDASDVVYRLFGHTRVMIYPASGSLRSR